MRFLIADVSESVNESSRSTLTKSSVVMEESCDTLLAQTIDTTGRIPESPYAGTSGCVVKDTKFSPDEIYSDNTDSSSKPPSDEISNSLEESSKILLTKVSDSVGDSIKSSFGEISDHVMPVKGDSKNTEHFSLSVILKSVEPSLSTSSELSVDETLETLEEAGMLPSTDFSADFTEGTSRPVLPNNLHTAKESDLFSNSTKEYSTFTSSGTLNSTEGTSEHSLIDTPDSIEKEDSKLSLAETVDMIDGSSNPSLTEILDSIELCSEKNFSEKEDTEENSKLSLDDAESALVRSSKPSLVETSNTTEESADYVDIISSEPVLAAKGSKMFLSENSEEENFKIELSETSDSLEQNFQPPLIDSSEDISNTLLMESSVEQNQYPVSTESLYSLEENSKSAATEVSDTMEENSKLTSTESSDTMEEKPESISTKGSNAIEENFESLDSVEEESKSVSPECLDSVKEIRNSILMESSDSLEEDSKCISMNSDSAEEIHKLSSAESSDHLEKNYKAALREGSESVVESSKSILTGSLENPQLLLPEIVYTMDECKPLSQESSNIVNVNCDALVATPDDVKGKSKHSSSVTQEGSELVSNRILRSNSAPLTKDTDSTEENETIPLHQRLLQSKNEVAVNDQLAGSSRTLRKSLAISVPKPADSVADSDEHHKGESNRVLRSSGTPKSDEPSVDQEVTGDVDLGHSKSRSKACTASTRRARLRKFSRRVRGELTQEERHLDPETLFYCRISGNIQENLLHHLDGKLEDEVTVKSRDWNRAGPSQPHTPVTSNQEEKHYHHHRTQWEKYNFPKNYDGRCGEGAVCLALYIKDMSHLDISTQLTMRQNLKRLSATPTASRSSVDVSAEITKDDVIGFSRGLCLSAKVCADRRRSLRSAANRGRDAPAAAPGGAASTFTASASMKRWSSADDVAAAESLLELSGEWVRPRSYICAACGVMFSDLWDLEDHKFNQHPNVWCTHYEFDQAALEQGTDLSKYQGGSMSPKDLCRQFLLVREAMEIVPLPVLSSEVKCTKCERAFSALPELHRHILECGGDTTWMLLPSPSSSGRRARKWRPFGSRRRRQQGSHRRGMKRNIPTTPVKQGRQRTVAGDSIQRMLANLPAKRSTRRVIQFSEDEIKTRSQGTIHSNRLLRKRYKVSLTSGMLRTSQKTGNKVIHSLQIKVTTADPSDSASKKMTVRSPKKFPPAPSAGPSATSEQSSVPKQQPTIKKQPRSKSQPVTSVPQSKSAGSDVQKKATRGGRSLSPATSKSEPVSLNGSDEAKQLSLHKSRGRIKKKQSLPPSCDGLSEPTKETSKKNGGPVTGMQEFDVDISNVGSTETSNILAAMRIAMLEGVVTETPRSDAATTKKPTKKVSTKKQSGLEENGAVLPGKRKKLTSSQENSTKKKTKLSQSELEERFLRNKGYTHPDEITDEPIICKGCGLQFDSGSAELRHRKTCIYVPSEENVGSHEVEQLHLCSHCCVQFPSVSTLLKHTQQCKAAAKSNTEVAGEPSTGPKKKKKTAAKAKTRNGDGNHGSTATTGKEEDVAGPKKSLGNIGTSDENRGKTGRLKAKPGVTKTKKQITKRSASDSRIIKRKKFDLTGSVDNNLDATEKWLTGAENINSCTTKRKVSSMEVVSANPVEMQKKLATDSTGSSPVRTKKKPDILENASIKPVGTKKKPDGKENSSSSPVETNKKVDSAGNVSSSLVGPKKKLNNTENARKRSFGMKKKLCGTEHGSNSLVESKKNVDRTENANIGPRKTKKKCNDTETGSGNPVRTKTKLDASHRPVTKKKKVDGKKNVSPVVMEKLSSTKNANSSPLGTENELDTLEIASCSPSGILESDSAVTIGGKKNSRNAKEFGSGSAVSRKKRGNIRSVSSSPVGAKKKLVSSTNYSPFGTNRKTESDSSVEIGQHLSITQSDSISPVVGEEQLDHSESVKVKKWVECDGAEHGTETVSNNPVKTKKRSHSAGSVHGSPIRRNSRVGNTEPADIILTETKKKFGNIGVLKRANRKSGSCESVSDNTNDRKDKFSNTVNGTCSPAISDIDDKMPELQKEEPIENLKTETPSPKVEDLCDIPILSPVGCEPLGEDHEEKKSSDTDLDEMLGKNLAEKKDRPSPVHGKKRPKVTEIKSTGLKQVRTAIKIRKPRAAVKKKVAQFEIPQIPLQIQPSKEETSMDSSLAVVEPSNLTLQDEVDGDDKPLAECLGASVATYKDETGKVSWEQDIKKATSPPKRQRRKRVQHKNTALFWDKQCREGVTKTAPQLTEEDSNDDLLPISKLKEVIQKKISPTEEIDSNISGAHDADCLVEQVNSRVTEGLEPVNLVERNCSTVMESESVAQHNTKEPSEIPDPVTLVRKSNATFKKGAVKKEKRDRTQSCHLDAVTMSDQHQLQAHQKVALSGGHPEIALFEGVHAGIQAEVEKTVNAKRKARKYTKHKDSQDNMQMEDSLSHSDHEEERNNLPINGCEEEDKRQMVTKKKRKRRIDEMQSKDGGSINSSVSQMQEEKGKCLLTARQETDFSDVGEKSVASLHVCEETGSAVGRKLLGAKRKKFGSHFVVAACPLDEVNNAVPCVEESKKIDHFVSDKHETKVLDAGKEHKDTQRERKSSLIGKKLGIAKTKSKRQMNESTSQYKDNTGHTYDAALVGESDKLISEQVADSDGTNSVLGKRLVVTKRKSKQQLESRYENGEFVDITLGQKKSSRPFVGKEAEANNTALGEQQDVPVFLCEEQETERQTEQSFVQTVLSCEEVTSLSVCGDIKVRRRKEVRNLSGKKRKASRVVNSTKETLLEGMKKRNSLTSKTDEMRQKIKLVIGKRRKRSLKVHEEQTCKLICEEQDKHTRNTETEDASLTGVRNKEIGDHMEADELSGKDKLHFLVIEEQAVGTSVADTDMNTLTCDTEEITNTVVDTDNTTNYLSSETEDAGTSVCWKEEADNLIGRKEIRGNMLGEKKSSNLEKDTSHAAGENGEGLITQVARMDTVDSLETKNVDNEEEYAAVLSSEQGEINSESLGSGAVTVKNGSADSVPHHKDCLNPVIIEQGDMSNHIVQMGSSSSVIDITSSVKAEESQVDVERPLRQARRTRCNTSYEELYTYSDVTSETEEDSSQDLPDANGMAVLCQDTDEPTYEEIAAMIANGGHFFPSSNKRKKKKKLRNNSRQYRNGHLRRKRRKKQKLRTKLLKKAKKSAVNDFIVTDIETGQEESQDSCESIVLAEILKAKHQPVDTETNMKTIQWKKKKKKKKKTESLVKPESEDHVASNENAKICDSDKLKQKRKSSVGSIFFCTLCNKHYSTNYNLMKHKLSLMHKRLSARSQLCVPADVQNTECEELHSRTLKNSVSEDTSPPVGQIIENELPNSVTRHMETEQPSSDNQNAETVACNSVSDSVETEQGPSSLVHSVEMEQPCLSVHNSKFEKYCSSLIQGVESENACSSVAQNLEGEHSCMVLNENTECENPHSVVQNLESEESCGMEPEQTYTLMQNMDVEQFSSTCMQSASLQDAEADKSGTCVEKPTSLQENNEQVLDSDTPIQNSTLDRVQQGTNPASNVGTKNEVTASLSVTPAGVVCGQAGVWTQHKGNVTSDWLGKERDLQQNMNASNWPASCEEQKQAGWFEGLVDNSQWMYTAGQWSQEMAWNREVNADMNWNADSSQDDGTFFPPNPASLGCILDSVNQILDNERSVDGLATTERYPPYMDLLQSGSADVDPNGGLRELQQAMGATDEEMAMLEQLGEGSWPMEDADIMDLDNQKSASATTTVAPASAASTPSNTVSSREANLVEDRAGEGSRKEEDENAGSSVAVAQAAVTTRTVSGRGGMRTQDMQLARYESKDMVCPVCSRRFLGLTALRAHLAAAHNNSTRHRTQAVIKRPRIVPSSSSEGSGEPTRHVCLVCKELLPDEQGLADHVGVAHVERQNPASKVPDQRPDGLNGSNHNTGGGGDEGLRSHMTSALGGLLTRALNNFLGKNRSQPSPPTTQVPSPSAGSSGGSRGHPLLTQPVARLLGRGLKMANRRHSSGPADEQPFSCVDCDERFTSESNRNRHIARAHRGQQYRRLSSDSPLELTRTASLLTSSENTASEVDTDNLPLSIRILNFHSGQRLVDREPCKSQLTADSTVGSEIMRETKEDHSSVKSVSSWKGEECSPTIVQETDSKGGTACNSGGEELERTMVAVKVSTDVGRKQEQERLSESSRTDWRNGMKAKASQLKEESLCSVSDEDSIKAKAVAALRALNARDRRIRNGLPGTIGAAMWSGVSRKKSRGLNSDDRFRFPLVRKTPPSTNRFASLAEKKKKNLSSMVKSETISQPKENTAEIRQEIPSMPLNAASPVCYDIYEFQDEPEQVQPSSEFGLAEFRLRAPVGKVGADTGPISEVEESRKTECNSLLKDPAKKAVECQPLSEQKGTFTPVVQEALENTKQKVLKPLKLLEQIAKEKALKPLKPSEENPKPKFNHSSRKHHKSKKKRWHRIIVDSEDDTSDTDAMAESHDTHRIALDQRLDNHRERKKSVNSKQQCEESGSIKRRHVVPCLSGVLVEDRQCEKRAKTARKPSKSGSKRATKTDLLMSVFAKSRQRNSSVNSVATGCSVPAKSPFCSTLLGPYRSVETVGSRAGAMTRSDSVSSATSGSAGNFGMSSDDEGMERGTKSQSKKEKGGQQKVAAL